MRDLGIGVSCLPKNHLTQSSLQNCFKLIRISWHVFESEPKEMFFVLGEFGGR